MLASDNRPGDCLTHRVNEGRVTRAGVAARVPPSRERQEGSSVLQRPLGAAVA
jgi:hypothetical protein